MHVFILIQVITIKMFWLFAFVFACLLSYVSLKSTCMRVRPCSCMCVRPCCPRAVQRMSRGCGGSDCVGSVTQRGWWWDRTVLQQQGTLQHQTQAGFEYCIRALELSPWTYKVLWCSSPGLTPYSGRRHHWACWPDDSGVDGVGPECILLRVSHGWVWAIVC